MADRYDNARVCLQIAQVANVIAALFGGMMVAVANPAALIPVILVAGTGGLVVHGMLGVGIAVLDMAAHMTKATEPAVTAEPHTIGEPPVATLPAKPAPVIPPPAPRPPVPYRVTGSAGDGPRTLGEADLERMESERRERGP